MQKGIDSLDGQVAIIGMACRFPGAQDVEQFWQNLKAGTESISPVEESEADSPLDFKDSATYVNAGAFLDGYDQFDAAFFGITAAEARVLDPQQRILLECAWEAFENAGYDVVDFAGRVGVFVGCRANTYLLQIARNDDFVRSLGAFQIGLGNDPGFLSTRISYKLNLRGPSISVQTACSTGLVNVHLACQSLLLDECQLALAGAVAVNVPHKCGYYYEPGSIFSPDGHCRAFDEGANGTVFGSGVGAIVLKRLSDAVADRDRIYAIIRGSAINNDGAAKASFVAPSVQGQIAVISEAHSISGIKADDVSYIEAHGTGTAIGDPIEIRALTKAFSRSSEASGYCQIGSVKSNVGHLDAAAGMAGLIKTILALDHRQIPATLHFIRPNPQINFDRSPFRVVTKLTDWRSPSPRRAGVSSFGVGGTNAHIVLEESPAGGSSSRDLRPQILTISTKTESAMQKATRQLADCLESHPNMNLGDVAYTLQVGRHPMLFRRAVIAESKNDAVTALRNAGSVRYCDVENPEVAFAFAGQSSQRVNMFKGLYHSEPCFRETLDQCAHQLLSLIDSDIREVLYPESDIATTDLNRTLFAQAGLFACQYACAQLWTSWGIKPSVLCGHSFGEYVAACIAGIFSLSDALRIVVARGRAMEKAGPGSMLAVRLSESEALPFCTGGIDLAVVNGPTSCVLSGPNDEIEALEKRFCGTIESVRLRTAHAFHSKMMEPILADFERGIRSLPLHPPKLPILSNVTGQWLSPGEACEPRYWVAQLRKPVRFADCITRILEQPGRIVLEIGPGRELSGMIRRHPDCTKERVLIASSPSEHSGGRESDVTTVRSALARLWTHGWRINWELVHLPSKPCRTALPTYPFERQRFWVPSPKPKPTPVSTPIPETENEVARWFYKPSWRLLPRLSGTRTKEAGHCWVIFRQLEDPLSDALERTLAVDGDKVVTVRPGATYEAHGQYDYRIDPNKAHDYGVVLESVVALNDRNITVVSLWTAGRSKQTLNAPTGNYEVFCNLLTLTQALFRTQAAQVGLCIVSTELHTIEEGDSCLPEKATLLGICKVVSQETSKVDCRNIDVRLPQDTGELNVLAFNLAQELHSPCRERILALRGNRRWGQGFEPADLHFEPLRPLRENGVYLITGGMGSVGLMLARHLAPLKTKLILLGRTSFPGREKWSEIASQDPNNRYRSAASAFLDIENCGGEVYPMTADTADEVAMQAAIQHILGRFGRLDGAIHAAGVTQGESVFQPFEEIQRQHVEEQFCAKVLGTRVLERVLRNLPLDFVLLFSSNAAVLGGLGLTSYAAANAFMDSFSESLALNSATPWISVNWDHWPEGTHQHKGFRSSSMQYAMTREQALQAFDHVVARAASGQTIVATGSLKERFAQWLGRTDALSDGSQPPQPKSGSVVQFEEDDVNDLERSVAQVWQGVLGIQRISRHDSFFDLGGDSLSGTRVVNRMRQVFDVELPLASFFEAPTIGGLALAIERLKTHAKLSRAAPP